MEKNTLMKQVVKKHMYTHESESLFAENIQTVFLSTLHDNWRMANTLTKQIRTSKEIEINDAFLPLQFRRVSQLDNCFFFFQISNLFQSSHLNLPPIYERLREESPIGFTCWLNRDDFSFSLLYGK